MTIRRISMSAAGIAAAATGLIYAQGRGPSAGWTTSRADAQRTAWVRSDSFISVENLLKPGFELQWKTKVSKTPGERLSEGVSGNTIQLNPQPGNVTGSANNLYAYEVDTGLITWSRHFAVPAGGAAATAACPGGLTGGVSRETALNQVVTGAGPGREGQARGPAAGGVGAPGEGVPAALMVGRGGGGRAASGRGPGGASGGGGGGRVGLRGEPVGTFVVSSDGVVHTIGQAQGKELEKPIRFLPPNANATGLLLSDAMLYTSTINGCGGVPNGVWLLNIPNQTVASWKSGASPVGQVAMSSAGVVYVAIGDGTAGPNGYSDAIVALDPKTLAVKDWFTMPGASFSSTPTLFQFGGRELLAAATKDGRVFVLDAASLGGGDHKTALTVSAATTTSKTWAPSALTTWLDASQGRWIAVPAVGASGGVVAFKVGGDGAKPSLTQAWSSSGNLASPSAPIAVNGVVFALNNGSAAAPAVLYAFDGASGKEIWNSGKVITSYVKSAGLWAMNGQVHVATNDATLWAFGTAQGR